MSDRFQNKYRVESARLRNWDYGSNAPYFVTICAHDRICFFGDVVDGTMVLNEIGRIAQDCWLEIPQRFPFARLGNHVVMPNHMHGIVVIDKPDDGGNENRENKNESSVETRLPDVDTRLSDMDTRLSVVETRLPVVETRLIASLPIPIPEPIPEPNTTPGGITGHKNPMLHNNLSKIIRWYKGRTTFESRKLHADFAWQSRFHDHIIRDEKSFEHISDYIIDNPLNWSADQFHI